MPRFSTVLPVLTLLIAKIFSTFGYLLTAIFLTYSLFLITKLSIAVAEQAPQKSKTGGWLRNLASVFVVMDETETVAQQPKATTTPAPTELPTTTPSLIATTPASDEFVEELRNRFRKILEDKNQPGFDFYEFSLMLLRTSSSPSVEHFKTAYEGAKLLNPNCSQAFLLESAAFYKVELQKAFEATMSAGDQKKTELNADKDKEQKQLNNEVAHIEQQLSKLKQQISDLEKAQTEKLEALNGIDSKFGQLFAEIEQKIQATVAAKEAVASEIVLIENGIKQYIA
ncbi:MAG: hypothetical protein R2822_18960 [Spirosomataceae bacterium]